MTNMVMTYLVMTYLVMTHLVMTGVARDSLTNCRTVGVSLFH
jgi:hypothetical protein